MAAGRAEVAVGYKLQSVSKNTVCQPSRSLPCLVEQRALMALLYSLLWRFLLVLVRFKRAVVSWLQIRLRSWRGRLWEGTITALLLPVAVSEFPEYQKKTNANVNVDPGRGNRADSSRARWLSDGRSLEKLPAHIGLMVAEEELSFPDVAKLVVWCMAVGVSWVSVYDNHGNLSLMTCSCSASIITCCQRELCFKLYVKL